MNKQPAAKCVRKPFRINTILDCLADNAANANEVQQPVSAETEEERQQPVSMEIEEGLQQAVPGMSAQTTPNLNSNSNSRDHPREKVREVRVHIDTAIMLAKMAPTRFASSEAVFGSFIRSREALKDLVLDEDWERLYSATTPEAKEKRNRGKRHVLDDSLYDKSRKIHQILEVLTIYLRAFDHDDAKLSEVFQKTEEARQKLAQIPLKGDFFTEERRSEIDKLFQLRRDGNASNIQVRLVDDIHYVALLLDPNKCPSNWVDFKPAFTKFAVSFLQGQGKNKEQVDEEVGELLEGMSEVTDKWQKKKNDYLSDETAKTLTNKKPLFPPDPLVYWFCYTFSFSEKLKTLSEFAVRVLSCSPTGSFVERSFSMHGDIVSKTRNRIGKEKVIMLIFLKWNILMLSGVRRFNKDDFLEIIMSSEYQDYMYEESQLEARARQTGQSTVDRSRSSSVMDETGATHTPLDEEELEELEELEVFFEDETSSSRSNLSRVQKRRSLP